MEDGSQDNIQTVAVLGGGTIGASWAAFFLSRGLAVSVVDPVVTEPDLRDAVAGMWPGLEALGLPAAADPNPLSLRKRIDHHLARVDFVQENCPEDLRLKQAVLAQLEDVIEADVIVSSSTSSLLPSQIQARARHPARVLVGHPFNPPHLVPLVEVVGGEQTEPQAIERAAAFYRRMGKVPVVVAGEAVGHIANRLTAALFREAVHLVAEGIASVEDIDTVVTQGPGLRWALLGPFLTYHLAGGSRGIAGYMEHLGPTQAARWRTLGAPELTPELSRRIVDDVLAMAGDHSLAALAQQRDAGLVQLQTVLRRFPDPHR